MNGPSDYFALSQDESIEMQKKAMLSLFKLEAAMPTEMAKLGLIVDLRRAIATYIESMNESPSKADLARLIIRDAAWRVISRKMFGDVQPGDATTMVISVLKTLKCVGLEATTHDYMWHTVAGAYYAAFLLTREIMRVDSLNKNAMVAVTTIAINDLKHKLGELIDKIVKGLGVRGLSRQYFVRTLSHARNQLWLNLYPDVYVLSPSTMFSIHSKLSGCFDDVSTAIASYINYSNAMIARAVSDERAKNVVTLIEMLGNEMWTNSKLPQVVIPIILALVEPHK